MKKATRDWVRKAEADYRAARKLSHEDDPLHDLSCFCCQQSAEKYLKALLEELGRPIPRTHILGDLVALLIPYYPLLRSFQRGLKFLTRFAVDIRYPSDWATKRQAASALRWAGEVRAACRTLLGIAPSRGRRRRSP